MAQALKERPVTTDPFEKISMAYIQRKTGLDSSAGIQEAAYIDKSLREERKGFMSPASPYVERDEQGTITRITSLGLTKISYFKEPANGYTKPNDFPVEALLGLSKGAYDKLFKHSVEQKLRESLSPKGDAGIYGLKALRDEANLIGKDLNDPKVFKEYSGVSFQEYGERMVKKMRDASLATAKQGFAVAETVMAGKISMGDRVVSVLAAGDRLGERGQDSLVQAFGAAKQVILFDAYLGKATTPEAVLETNSTQLAALSKRFSVVGKAHSNGGRYAHTDEYETPLTPDLAKPPQDLVKEALGHKFDSLDSLLSIKRAPEIALPAETLIPGVMDRALKMFK